MTCTAPFNDSVCCCRKKSSLSLHLPAAPKRMHRMQFEGESAPVRAVPLEGAVAWLKENSELGVEVEEIHLDGPGDPLAEPELTLELLHGIEHLYPKAARRITTLGLQGKDYAKKLAKAGVTHATLLVDAIEPTIAQKIYAWIRPGTKTIPLTEAATLLIAEQAAAVKALHEAGIAVTMQTTIYRSYNDDHALRIAEKMAGLGAQSILLVPFRCAEDTGHTAVQPDQELMVTLLKEVSHFIPAAAIAEKKESGLGRDCPAAGNQCQSAPSLLPKPSKERPNVAVVSSNGMEIDLHLGQAFQLLIYGPREDGLTCLLGTRPAPEPGSGGSRWEDLARLLPDCFALLAASAGASPRTLLSQHGITVLITEDAIEGTVDQLFGGGKKKRCK